MNILYIIVGVLAVIIFWVIIAYNSFISLINQTKNAWSDIEVQLKRRASLIPNLVETVKGYAKHEKGVFEEVTKARSALMNAKNPPQAAAADDMLTNALKSLFAVAEAYPNLRASENFSNLQGQLTETEDKIENSRRFYNANVRELNIKIETFPYNIIANIFHFQKRDFFEASEEAKKDVEVSFS
ncbi:LemA family protein [Candidatus Parcubacteria bacterium]|nr:MAG: LemA family protein [Candidatus Parcubacteria bacterium]